MPTTFLISTIHMPALGNMSNEVEKVPISNNGVLNPMPKANKSRNPKKRLFSVATMLSKRIRPGETQGEAIVPLATPNINEEKIDPEAPRECRTCSFRGTYKSYKPNIESAK